MKGRILVLILLGVILASLVAPLASMAQTKEVTLYTHGWWQPPPARRYNPFAPKSIVITGLIYERLAFWNKLNNTYFPQLAESWEIDKANNQVIVHLRKNVYWHDGTPFTCKDVWTTLMIYKAQGRKIWNYIDDVTCKDDYTVVYHVKKWAYLLMHYLLFVDGLITGPYHLYGKYAEEIAKAKTKDEMAQILKNLIDYEPEKPIGTGPFMFDKITSSEVVLVKFPKYYWADKVTVDKVVMPYITSNEVGWQYYRAGKLDYDVFMMPPQVKEELLQKPFTGIAEIYDLSGFALVFNFNNKWLQKLEVRQAIAYAIDRQKVADAAGKGLFEPVEYPTGLLKVSTPWIEDLIKAGVLEKYQYNPDKAKQLLEKAGFTYKDGKWYTPDGEPFKLTMIAPGGWTDWDAAAQEIANELKAFGIDVELTTPESPSYWSDQWYLGGNYDLAIDFFGAWMVYPWAAFERMFVEVNNRPRTIVQGQNFPETYYLDYFKKEINATQLVEILATSFDPNEQKQAAEMLAYAANHYLPEYPIAEKKLVIFYNKEHFIWPDPQKYYYLWQNAAGGHLEALAFMISHGFVKPNPEYWGITTTPTTTTSPTTTTTSPSPTTTSAPAPGTVTQTVTQTSTQTVTTTVTQTVTETNWGAAIGLFILGLIIGIAIGYAIKRK